MKYFIEQISKMNARQNYIIATSEYIDWLYKFTVNNPKISTNECKPQAVKWTKNSDEENIDLVPALYSVIDSYHLQNQLKSHGHGQYKWYNIKYKDAYFLVGIFMGQDVFYFVQRCESSDCDTTDFHKIRNELSEVDVDDIFYRTSQFETMIKELREMGMSYDELIKVFQNAYK